MCLQRHPSADWLRGYEPGLDTQSLDLVLKPQAVEAKPEGCHRRVMIVRDGEEDYVEGDQGGY